MTPAEHQVHTEHVLAESSACAQKQAQCSIKEVRFISYFFINLLYLHQSNHANVPLAVD